jgi:hypothetical protein
MLTGRDVTRIALALEGTQQAPHFERTAFKVARIYATLAADGRSVNLRLTPDEQALKCTVAPGVFAPVDNAWGAQGWTTMSLAVATRADAEAALTLAWQGAQPKPKRRRRA